MSDNNSSEEVFFDGEIPVKAFLGQYSLAYLIIFGWNIGLLEAWINSKSHRLKITSERVVLIKGLISRTEEDIPLYRATDCGFRQNIIERFLGTGEIELISEDITSPRLVIPFITPNEYKERIRAAITTERRRMRSINMD